MTLSMMLGTPLEPDLSGPIPLAEEVSEYLYAFDRVFFHVTSVLAGRGLAGLRLGRVSDGPEQDRKRLQQGKRVSVRVVVGGGRYVKKKKDLHITRAKRARRKTKKVQKQTKHNST